jgi:hypothetical protein
MSDNFVKIFDDCILYKNNAHCRLQIFSRSPFFLVAFTELKANKGTSITNAIEELIRQVEDRFERKLFHYKVDLPEINNMVVLYAERYETHPHYFDWVQLGSNRQPIWTRATEKEIRTILPLLDEGGK